MASEPTNTTALDELVAQAQELDMGYGADPAGMGGGAGTTECQDPAIPVTQWLKLTPRQMELMLWQLLANMGGEVSTIPPDDKPTRTVMFYRDRDEYVGMICNEECGDE